MAFQYEVDTIRDHLYDIERIVDSVIDALCSADLAKEMWERLEGVQRNIDFARNEIDDIENAPEIDYQSIASSLRDIESIASDAMNEMRDY